MHFWFSSFPCAKRYRTMTVLADPLWDLGYGAFTLGCTPYMLDFVCIDKLTMSHLTYLHPSILSPSSHFLPLPLRPSGMSQRVQIPPSHPPSSVFATLLHPHSTRLLYVFPNSSLLALAYTHGVGFMTYRFTTMFTRIRAHPGHHRFSYTYHLCILRYKLGSGHHDTACIFCMSTLTRARKHGLYH